MNKDYYSYAGSAPQDNWIKIVDDIVQSKIPYQDENTISWNALPDKKTLKKNLCVRVLSEDWLVHELPAFIKSAPDIVYLDLPLRFVKNLQPDSIPTTVKTLGILGDNSEILSPDIYLPQVERLLIGYGELIFDDNNFPNLRHLEFKIDRKKIMLKRLPTFNKLEVLSIYPCPKEVFSIISKLNLKYLRLNRGLIENLEGIEKLQGLTDLWLQSLTKLSDLTPLSKLPRLEDLTITYCKQINLVKPLLEIKNLKRLFVYECKNKAIQQIAPLLECKLNELSIS